MKKVFVALLVFALLFADVVQVGASRFLFAFSVHSECGQRIFHINPGGFEHGFNFADFYYWGEEDTITGIYDIESGEAIWLLEDLCYRSTIPYPFGIMFSYDMSYFVRLPQVRRDSYALEFFAYGEFVRGYRMDELVQDMNHVRLSSADDRWENRQARRFNSENNLLRVVTVDGQRHVFDIVTGELFVSPEPMPEPQPELEPISTTTLGWGGAAAIWVAMLVTGFGLGTLMVRRKRRQRMGMNLYKI